ncbi:uncharacterized protein [Elaeis guineensis]|uniref:RING-type E3 ubiquitin transferase n=1 Tax=Elaeis guineensis var. tenera TaxID=51953 RepID=A0A8N4F6D3_ELAGV|nr:E3 ubiquitin-protein ligase RNF12-A isoform X2 [Elaeis guineensis]
MDGYMGRKTAMGLVFSRGGSSLAFREQNFEDGSIKYCNRLGCSTRLYSMNGIQTGKAEKVKYSRGSFHSMNSKTITGSSTTSFHACDLRKTHQERRRQTSLQGRDIAETRNRQRETEDLDCEGRRWEADDLEYHSRQGEPEDSESIHITRGNQTVFSDPDEFGPVNLQGFSGNAAEALGGCSTRLSSRACNQVRQQCRYGDQGTSSSSSTRNSLTFRNTSQPAKHASRGGGLESKKYNLKHLRSTPSDIVPSGNLSARGQSKGASLSGANLGSSNRGSSVCGLSLPGHSMPQQALSRTGAISVRTRSRRAPSGVTRTRLSEERDYSFSAPEAVAIAQMPQTHFSASLAVPESSSRSSFIEVPLICHDMYGRHGSSHCTGQSSPIAQPGDSSAQTFNVPMGDGNGYQHFNLEGNAEVLLPLERIEQDEELTSEQLLVLGMNLFLDGLNFHDQHRDMRMDIDNMSYEELLALGEKMGTVSTALTEEALSKCLKRSIYMPASLVSGFTGYEEDIKCSICQEEYVVGDEVGKLACEHRYHVTCIHQWLRQKNWCPICKASACPVS